MCTISGQNGKHFTYKKYFAEGKKQILSMMLTDKTLRVPEQLQAQAESINTPDRQFTRITIATCFDSDLSGTKKHQTVSVIISNHYRIKLVTL